jgi:hypothetical protein
VADGWNVWWQKRGDETLSLLLWAVWNPIGPVPLDEYAGYTARIVSVLRRAYDADQELSPPGTEIGDGDGGAGPESPLRRQHPAGQGGTTCRNGVLQCVAHG